MSRFNQSTAPAKTTNFAGGQAYGQSNELELLSIMLTNFVTDGPYRSAEDTLARVKQLVIVCDPKFVAQAALFARKEYGMRSISHVVASEVAKNLSGLEWASRFYDQVIFRPDDMMEILSYHKANNGKIPNAMKKGLAKAFDKFDAYQLSKYRGEGKSMKLVDVVNIVHPVPVIKNADALRKLVAGTLKSEDTWEAGLSKAGQSEDSVSAKAYVWEKLLTEKKLGYLALLRNLRNIMEQAPAHLWLALEQLINPGFIKKSMVFPFQYLIAYKQFAQMGTRESRLITEALSRAVDISCANIKEILSDGDNLIVVDNSGSMDSPVAGSVHMMRNELGALFGIVLAKAMNADIMEFADYARYINFNLSDHSMQFAANFKNLNQVNHGTNFHSIFQTANKKYDRILIFSDMQGWRGHYTPDEAFKNYKRLYQANPFVYSFDLAGLGTMQFPEKNVFCLAGFSDKIFDTMKMLETDKNALVNQVKSIEI